jgi:flagellar protein FliJ
MRSGRIALMERMISEYERMVARLDLDILAEQERVKIHDPTHFAYPIYAKASAFRRENMKRSADELRVQLAKANQVLTAIC